MERLRPRLQVMIFMGNFEDDLNLWTPVSVITIIDRGIPINSNNVYLQQVDAVIAASKSVVSSPNLKKILEVSIQI